MCHSSFLGSVMFSERNMHIVARLAAPKDTGKTDGQQCTVRRPTMCIFLSENITDSRKCEWHMQAFEYFLQKTLGIPENDEKTLKIAKITI